MKTDRKLRACFISALLLLSSLSIIILVPENAKADSGDITKLYFHDLSIDETTTNEKFIESIMLKEGTKELSLLMEELGISDLLDIDLLLYDEYGEINSTLIVKLVNFCLEHPKTIGVLSSQLSEYGVIDEVSNQNRVLNVNQPTKTNLSKSPNFNLDTLIDADGTEDIIMALLNMISSLAPFTASYVYNGEETLDLDGQIDFSLFFERQIDYIWNSDNFTISLYIYDTLEKKDKYNASKHLTINRREIGKISQGIANYDFSFEIKDVKLGKNDLIYVEIERDSGNKLLLELFKDNLNFDLSELSETLEIWGETLNSTNFDSLKEIGQQLIELNTTINSVSEMFNESDVIELIYTLIVEVMSSSFVYDSLYYQSYISVPCELPKDRYKNTRVYYLHLDGSNNGILNENEPTNDEAVVIDLSKDSGLWNSSDIDMSKILKKVTMGLYLNYRDLVKLVNILRGRIKIYANLYSGDDELVASAEKELQMTTILNLIEKSDEPVMFNFTIESDKEITYDSALSLELFISNQTKFGLGLFRSVKLLYDSKDYPSYLIVEFDETDNIKMDVAGPETIAAADIAHYELNVTSKHDDTISFSYIRQEEEGDWEIKTPESVKVTADSYTLLDFYIISKAKDEKAYKQPDMINLLLSVEGKTGKYTEEIELSLSEDDIVYDVDFIAPEGMTIKKGESDNYHIIVINNNTGLKEDSYDINARSSHGWDVEIDFKNKTDPYNVEPNGQVEFYVKLSVPKDTGAKSDVLTIIVNTTEGKQTFLLNITTTVGELSIVELIYDFFESVAESLGLDSVLGEYAAWSLIFILLFIILMFFIIAVYLASRKHVQLVCLDRVKEISPDEQAIYEIAIHNPSNNRYTYEICLGNNSSPNWEAFIDTNSVVIEPKQSFIITLTVRATDMVRPNDWVETKVLARAVEKNKTDSISTITSISDEKPDLRIIGVLHWPKVFSKGDKVTTSFKLENRGRVAAEKLTVVLYVNGEEKNKVEDITIPSGGYADIEIPWIAVKGKNDVDIVVK